MVTRPVVETYSSPKSLSSTTARSLMRTSGECRAIRLLTYSSVMPLAEKGWTVASFFAKLIPAPDLESARDHDDQSVCHCVRQTAASLRPSSRHRFGKRID